MGKQGRLASGLFLACTVICGCADVRAEDSEAPIKQAEIAAVRPFTGKVTTNRVRMRLEPSLMSTILDEFNEGDMLVVTGQDEDFYAVRPRLGTKAFVFRTYVLDNVIEGSHVNVRLEPHLDAPVIAQLNTGDKVEGQISALNSKWFEIDVPEDVRFYVAHDFVERVGDPELMTRLEKRRQEANNLVNTAYVVCQEELTKSFEDIDIEAVTTDFQTVLDNYSDVAEEQERARYFLSMVNDRYLRRRINHLETEAKYASEQWHDRCLELAKEMSAHNDNLDAIERDLCEKAPELAEKIGSTSAKGANEAPAEVDQELVALGGPVPPKAAAREASPPEPQRATVRVTQAMLAWIPKEAIAYERWVLKHRGATIDDFYAEQQQMSMQIKGRLQPYPRPVKNKPGNFLLLDSDENLPMAFVYSTKVNLDELVGQKAVLHVAPRPSNNFAFPAYFVIDARSDEQESEAL